MLSTGGLNAQATVLDIGIFNNPENSNRLEIRIKPNRNISGQYSAGVFTIMYPTSYGVTLSVASAPFAYEQLAPRFDNGFTYYSYNYAAGFPPTVNWLQDQEIPILVLQHSNNGVGVGTFEIANDAFVNGSFGTYYQEFCETVNTCSDYQNIIYQPSTSSPLPVSLLYFKANLQDDKTVKLDWRSELEKELYLYEVEHSTNGQAFTKIGQVAAKGSPTTQVGYEFIHPEPQTGTNYYRLRMSDRWGKGEYTPVRIVRLEDKSSAFQVLPNPTSGPISLIVNQLEQFKDELYYQVTDVNGKLLLENRLVDTKTAMDFSNYPSGAYYLNIRSERERLHQFKIVITPK